MNDFPIRDAKPAVDPPAARIRGIALDMDGLLFDTERLYWQVGDTVLQRRGHRFSKQLQQRMMGRVGVSAIEQMIEFHDLQADPRDLLEESEQIYEDLLTQELQPMPGLEPWIELLSASGLPYGLATSSRRKFVDMILDTVSWKTDLSFILTGDDVTRGKPDPQMYEMAAQRLQVATDEMLVLEDSSNGCAAAVAAGALTVAVPSPHTQGQDFTGAILVANSLEDPRLRGLVSAVDG